LNIFNFLGFWPVLNDLDLSGIHAESAGTNDIPKVFHRIRVETTLVTIYKETMFVEASEYLFDMLLVVNHVVGKDEDVVQVDSSILIFKS